MAIPVHIFIPLVLVAFFGMEAVSYLAHRYVYHGIGWRFHESHHSRRTGVFEKNDVFPAFFASCAIVLMAVSVYVPGFAVFLPISIGISMYGMTYFFIHDLYVHRRNRRLRLRIPVLLEIKRAHAIHHADGGEPYGLLFFHRDDRYRRQRQPREEEVV
jgi:beta-carotene 3-hydroxylase